MSTGRQIAANRANALRSTGPRTADGKAASSQNALRHGLTAERIVISGEDAGDFEDFLQELVEHYKPRNRNELLMVERLAGLCWRLMRVPVFEAALLGAYAHQAESTAKQDALMDSMFNLDSRAAKANAETEGEKESEALAPSQLGRMLEAVLGRTDVLGKLARHEAHLCKMARQTRGELDRILKDREANKRTAVEDTLEFPASEDSQEADNAASHGGRGRRTTLVTNLEIAGR